MSEQEAFAHATNAMIAAQLEPVTRASWLARCDDGTPRGEKVAAAQAQIKNPDFPCGSTGVRALRR